MAFTSCLLAEMAGKHEVGMHDPIKKFLPPEVQVPSLGGQDISLLDLGNHSSGLPRIPVNFPETITDPQSVAQLHCSSSACFPE